MLVTDGNRIPDFIDKAFEIAVSGNPGPVHLSIPTDLLYSSYDEREEGAERPFKHVSPSEHHAWPDPAGVAHLDKLFRQARQPVIVAGSGVWWGRAERELADFATSRGIPTLVVPYHQHLFAQECPAYCGLADIHQYPPAEYALHNADLIVTFGCRLDNMLNFGSPPLLPARALLACVDASADDAGANHAADWRLLGHPQQVIAQLNASAQASPWATPKDWLEANRRERKRWIDGLTDLMRREGAERPMHPLFVSMAVMDTLGANDYLVIDGGDAHYWAEMALNVAEFNGKTLAGVFHPGPMSLLGCGTAFGLTIKMKHPESNVVVLSGDGAFLSSGLSIETSFNENLPITVVVDNNRGLCLLYTSPSPRD